MVCHKILWLGLALLVYLNDTGQCNAYPPIQESKHLTNVLLMESDPIPDKVTQNVALEDLNYIQIQNMLRKFTPDTQLHLQKHVAAYKWISSMPESRISMNAKIALTSYKYILNSLLEIEQHNLQGKNGGIIFRCPDPAEIAPCECTITDMHTLDCSRVGSFVEMKNILDKANFPSTNFDKFIYYPSKPSTDEATLLDNTFGLLTFQRIYIGNSGLLTIEPEALNGSQKCLELFMSDSNQGLLSFPFNKLPEYENLAALFIIHGALQNVPNLKSVPSMLWLDFNSNHITKIDNYALSKLPILNVVDFSYNELVDIKPPGLYLSSMQVFLYLDHTQLQDISPYSSPAPNALDISSNSLTTFDESVYKPLLDEGSYVDVSSNPIDCSAMEWVYNDPKYSGYVVSDCYRGKKNQPK